MLPGVFFVAKTLRVYSRLLVLTGLAAPSLAFAHTPHECPSDIADIPALKVTRGHIEQTDLVAGSLSPDKLFTIGGAIADSRWNACDGQGRPATTGDGQKRAPAPDNNSRVSGPEGTSCGGCHGLPRSGGAGDFVANTYNGAETLAAPIMSIDPSMSNERNTTGMFGAGHIELVAREMTADLQSQASTMKGSGWKKLKTHGVSFDVQFRNGKVIDARGIDPDLVVKPFGAGGTKVSIRQFTVEAFNRHHGMQAEERYDMYLADPDFDEDGIQRELTVGDITTVSLWQAMLDQPLKQWPTDEGEAKVAVAGAQAFEEIGCEGCHVRKLPLYNHTFCEPNPYNPPGIFSDTSQSVCEILDITEHSPNKTDFQGGEVPMAIEAYTDLKRHNMCDPEDQVGAVRLLCNEQLDEERRAEGDIPATNFFLTADLWQVGESAPYGHNGHFPSLSSIILAHGGEARASRDAFAALPADQQIGVIKFLKALKIRNQRVRPFDG